jgi:hypothetical protein
MILRSNRHSRPVQVQRGPVPRLAVFALVVLVLSAFVTACQREEPGEPREEMVSLRDDMSLDQVFGTREDILSIQRFDADSDQSREWVLFYRLEQLGQNQTVAALIYDVVHDPFSQLPVIYPYRLRTPDQNYLATVVPTIGLAHVVPEVGSVARPELYFKTDSELVIFRLTREPGGAPTDNPPLYRCIGFFRSNAGVDFDPAQGLTVTVTSRNVYERSQLVKKEYYAPGPPPEFDGYFITTTNLLKPPAEYEVDLPEGLGAEILQTPYPEKIVLAFYKTLGRANPQPPLKDYLTQPAAELLAQGKLNHGSPYAPNNISRAVVKEILYFATQEESTVAKVIVGVVFRSTTGQQSALTERTWILTRGADRQWRMDHTE